jgi:flagellar export protein FliJ
MQRFRFRLASVLKWRTLQLEIEQSKLETLFAERNRCQAELARLEECRSEADGILTGASIDGQQLAALDNHRTALKRAGAKTRSSQADCERRIAVQRGAVAEAERRMRLLERLQERRREEWDLKAARELETLASETFLAKWVRERRA